MDNSEIELFLNALSPKRREHTKAVASLASELAVHYGVSSEDAYIAGMLHDVTKEYDLKQQLHILNKSDIITDIANINLVHSLTAFILLQNKNLSIDILNAIKYHTTLRSGASMLEKIIYVADSCSYDREYLQATTIRQLAFDNINEAIIEIIEFTINTLIKNRKQISVLTIECYNEVIKENINEN